MVDLKGNTETCLQIAKEILETKGHVVPVAVFIKNGLPILPIPLSMVDSDEKEITSMFVQEFILRFKPDVAVLITEAWMVTRNIDNFDPADISNVSECPDKIEVLLVDGAAIGQRYSIIQPFHWEGSFLVFDKQFEQPKNASVDNYFFGTVWEMLEAEGQTVN